MSYRNQSFDLQSKANDWFLYEIQNWAEIGYTEALFHKLNFLEFKKLQSVTITYKINSVYMNPGKQ